MKSELRLEELVAVLREAPTSTVSDALDTLGVSGVILGLQPVVGGTRFAGPALTVKEVCGPLGSFDVQDLRLDQLIDGAAPGAVIVIDNGGAQVSTWGGVATAAASQRGLAAVVVEGGVRDVDRMRALGFPVFARHIVPISPRTRVKLEGVNLPIVCGGIAVRPGDLVVGDDTGLVAIPGERLAEVVARVRQIQQLKTEHGIYRFELEKELWPRVRDPRPAGNPPPGQQTGRGDA